MSNFSCVIFHLKDIAYNTKFTKFTKFVFNGFSFKQINNLSNNKDLQWLACYSFDKMKSGVKKLKSRKSAHEPHNHSDITNEPLFPLNIHLHLLEKHFYDYFTKPTYDYTIICEHSVTSWLY